MGMPGKSFQSQLEPHYDFILQARRNHQTWDGIAQSLAAYGITTTKQAVHAFIKRRLKRRYALGMAPAELRPASPPAPEPEKTALPRPEELAPDLSKVAPSERERIARALTTVPIKKGPIWKIKN